MPRTGNGWGYFRVRAAGPLARFAGHRPWAWLAAFAALREAFEKGNGWPLVGRAAEEPDCCTRTGPHIETLGLRAGEHLLDIGCGTGLPAVRIAQRSGGRVTGINVSQLHLARSEETARSEGVSDRVSFRYGNAMALDFPDESFDAAMSIDVYAHLSDRQQAFHETARVLRPGGHFMMSEFTIRGTGTPSKEGLAAYLQVWRNMPPTTPAQTIDMAANAGFELDQGREHVPEHRVQRRADGTAIHRPARRDR